MKKNFLYLIAILLLTAQSGAFAQQERIINWDFSSKVTGANPYTLNNAWNEFDFEVTEIKSDDADASNGRSLKCKRSKNGFFGKDAYGIGNYGGRAQSVIPCPQPGTEYTFSARARVNTLEDENPGEIALYFYNDNEDIIYNPIFKFSNTTYDEQSLTFTVPADAVWCRIWVRKDASVDFFTDWVSLKTTTDDTPEAVTNFRATDIGTSKVLLGWDTVEGASGYKIERKLSLEDDTNWSTKFITYNRGSRSSFMDSRDGWKEQLEPGVQYDYRIIALGDYGNSDTTTTSVTTISDYVSSPGNTTYYIDATDGDDVAAGTSEATAWKSFMNIDRMELAPGDKVLLKTGEYWKESLILHGNGAEGNEITVASYGTAQEKPVINVEGEGHAAVRLMDVSYYTIKDLELSNFNPFFREFYKYAVEAGTWRTDTVYGLHFDNLFINKVRGIASRGGNLGFIDNGQLTAGIRLATDIRASNPNDRVIYNASITNCELQEIEQHGMHLAQIDGLTITNNIVNRGGYTGMLCRRLYNGTIANNNFIENGYFMTCNDNAGVGFYGGDNILFEKNVVYKTYNENSGQSLNMDGCDNWILQYNFFKDSGSGCFVINHGASGNIFRYNISEGLNDQWFRNLGGINTQIYNNTVYVYKTNISPKGFFVSNSRTVSKDPKPTENTQVYNNIFIREQCDTAEIADIIYEHEETINSEFSNNVFYGNFSDNITEDINPFFDDPLFVNPGSSSLDLNNYTLNADGYTLQAASPYNTAGLTVTDNGGLDFWGNIIPAGVPSIGAYQPNSTAVNELTLEKAHLSQNYPNPFNSTTYIQYSVPESDINKDQQVILRIYDMQGRVLKTLVNEYLNAGVYSVEWNRKDNNGKAVNSGIYFYSIVIGDFVDSKKMVVSQ